MIFQNTEVWSDGLKPATTCNVLVCNILKTASLHLHDISIALILCISVLSAAVPGFLSWTDITCSIWMDIVIVSDLLQVALLTLTKQEK